MSDHLAAGRPRMNWPHDSPGPGELVEAVRAYLAEDLGPRSDGRDRFLLRVAANALAIAGREIESGAADAAAHAARLVALGVESEAERAERIRAGDFDDRWEELAPSLWATTLDKLAVANPDYRDEALEHWARNP